MTKIQNLKVKIISLKFSQACENNKDPILNVLKKAFVNTKQILEVGSGTGQHSVFFAEHLPHVLWQTSDLSVHHYSINTRKEESKLTNLFAPITLDLTQTWLSALKQSSLTQTPLSNSQTATAVDGVFTANTFHIISWSLVKNFFQETQIHLAKEGILCIYRPFNYQRKFTSESNAEFDKRLKLRDPESGIRDFEEVQSLANQAGLTLIEDHTMPANNRLLVFKKD